MGPNKPRDRTKASDPKALSETAVRRRSVGPGVLACPPSPVLVRRPIGSRAKTIAKALLAAAFVTAGILHLTAPGPFLAITPDWVVWPQKVIRVTGLLEILGATALYVPRLRRAAGLALAAYAICVSRPTSSVPWTRLLTPAPFQAGGIMAPGWRFSRSSSGGRCGALA